MATWVYPLDLPSAPGIVSGSLRLRYIQAKSTSPFTFATQIHAYPGDRWEGDFKLPRMTQAQVALWEVFVMKLRGQYGTFLWGPVEANMGSLDVSSSGLNVDSFHSDGYGCEVSGFVASETDVLKAGDFISFSNNEMKKVMSDVSSDSNGDATIYFEPAIRDDAVAGSGDYDLEIFDPKGAFRLASPEFEVDFDVAQKYGMSIVFEEDITA